MKILKVATIVYLVLSFIVWYLLVPRYARPDDSAAYKLFVGFLAVPLLVGLGLIPGSLFSLILFREKAYLERLKLLTMVFTIIFSMVFSVVAGAILILTSI